MNNSNYFRTGSNPGLTNLDVYLILGLFIPKRVDYIGFNDPLLILPKNESNIKRPNAINKLNLMIFISTKSNPK